MKKWIKFVGFLAGSGTIAAIIVGGYYGLTSYFKNNPGSAETVIRRYNNAGYDNYRLTYNLIAKSSVTDPENVVVTTPVSLSGVFDRYEDTYLLDCNASMDVYTEAEDGSQTNNQSVLNYSYDSYVDKSNNQIKLYVNNNNGWSETEATETDYSVHVSCFSDLDPELFKNASLETKNNKFIIKVPTEDIVNSTYLDMIVGDAGLITDFYEGVFTGDDLRSALVNGETVYTFDKQSNRLETVEINSLSGTASSGEDDNIFTAEIKIDMSINISDYGKIKSFEPTISSETDNNEDENQSTEATEASVEVDHGQYSDTQLNAPISWSVFRDDGWIANPDSENMYSFVSYTNEKYPNYLLLLFGKGAGSINHADIERRGAYDYSIIYEGTGDPVTSKPPFSWKGVTFGSSPDEVIAAYGDPLFHAEDEETGDKEYSYDFDDYSSIDFAFKNNKLIEVTVYVSTW